MLSLNPPNFVNDIIIKTQLTSNELFKWIWLHEDQYIYCHMDTKSIALKVNITQIT